MKKQTLLFTVAVLLSALFITGCGDDTPKTYDESQHIGIYTGKHALADSAALRTILEDPDLDVFFDDSLTITNGSSTTDGKLTAVSKYLNGKIIEIDLAKSTSNITPTSIGSLTFGPVTLNNVKLNTGSNATWNGSITIASTNLVAAVDFGAITGIPVRINGTFTKQ
ncbi:MAG TPA: hypothetical protein PK355_10565 [Chitinophagales bacterium]|jgi:hypothetical protein|nr:hypothetical protein [Chitinophagales bacterium]